MPNGQGLGQGGQGSGQGGQGQMGSLDTLEQQDLIYMREEEKLAHDVYQELYQQWGLPVFANIAASEQKHTDAVANLLDRYNLEDPAEGNPMGVFEDESLQALYNTLMEQGMQSLTDALNVGVTIEETDIVDLQEAIETTDNRDIERVYTNLMNGSYNHLNAFTSALEQEDSLLGTNNNQIVGDCTNDPLMGGKNSNSGQNMNQNQGFFGGQSEFADVLGQNSNQNMSLGSGYGNQNFMGEGNQGKGDCLFAGGSQNSNFSMMTDELVVL